MKNLFTLFLFLLFSGQAFAQLSPVRLSFSADQVSDGEYEIIVSADIQQGWSVYSLNVDAEAGPIPTQVAIEKQSGIQIVGTPREVGFKSEVFDAVFGTNLVKFTRKAKFKQTIKVEPGTPNVQGHIIYMTCNDQACLPPIEVPFTVSL